MRLENRDTTDKIQMLQNLFIEGKVLTIAQIQEILESNRITANNYIKRLEKRGLSLKKIRKEGRVHYFIDPDSSADLLQYTPMSADILRKLTIVRTIQDNPRKKMSEIFILSDKNSKDNMANEKDSKHSFDELSFDRRIPLDIKLTQFRKLLQILKEQGELEEKIFSEEESVSKGKMLKKNVGNRNSTYLLPTGKEIPLFLSMNEDELWRFYQELENMNTGSPYYQVLHSLHEKVSLLIGEPAVDSPYHHNYLIYGRKIEKLGEVHKQIQKIAPSDYKSRVLEIEYHTSKEVNTVFFFSVGVLVYSVEKDILYLIGETDPPFSVQTPFRILKADQILSVRETSKKNKIYNSVVYQTIFEEMFSISTRDPEHIVVEFDREEYIERKIAYLQKQRKACVQKKEDVLIYSDTIRGLLDFANYLRQFGEKVHVVEPEILKNMMNRTVVRTLARYEELQNDE